MSDLQLAIHIAEVRAKAANDHDLLNINAIAADLLKQQPESDRSREEIAEVLGEVFPVP